VLLRGALQRGAARPAALQLKGKTIAEIVPLDRRVYQRPQKISHHFFRRNNEVYQNGKYEQNDG
jgi:antitoxin (DNA-binding transcriptional repressor) of toxin-antitoxin stability system